MHHKFFIEFGDNVEHFKAFILNLVSNFRRVTSLIVSLDLRENFQQIDDAFKAVLFADGNLNGYDAAAEFVLELRENFFKIGMFAIHFRDEECARKIQTFRQSPGLFGLNFDARAGTYDDNRRISRRQCPVHFRNEIGEAGHVNGIDLEIFPLKSCKRRAD